MEKKFTIYMLVLALAGLFAMSCSVKEDRDQCIESTAGEREIRVYVDYDKSNISRTAFNPSEVDFLTLFVFDKDGMYYETDEDEVPDLTGDYYFELDLPPGEYSFIVWSNLHSFYGLKDIEVEVGKTSINDLFIELQTPDNDTIPELPYKLFYGSLMNQQVKDIDGLQRFDLGIIKNSYIINLFTEGYTSRGEDHRMTVTDKSTTFAFDNSVQQNRTVHYANECILDDDDQIYGTVTVLRLMEDNPIPILKLENTVKQNVIFQDNLVDLILSLRNEGVEVDFDKIHEYTIVLKFQGDMVIGISINGWNVVRDYIEL